MVQSSTSKLCDLLLEVVGRNCPQHATARRHVLVLDQAIPMMSKAQAQVARARIKHHETRWGRLLPGTPEINCTQEEIAPEHRIAKWLIRRKSPERLMRVLKKAALAVWEGIDKLTEIMDRAYEQETDRLMHPVSYGSFKQWMLELRIGQPEKEGYNVRWVRGEDIEPWVKDFQTLYTASLMELVQLKAKRRRKGGGSSPAT